MALKNCKEECGSNQDVGDKRSMDFQKALRHELGEQQQM